MSAAPTQGRGKADRVGRLRSQVWFCLICAQRQPPWVDPAAMDKFFLKLRHGPYRTFERIRDNCSNPGLKSRNLMGRSAVDLVAETNGYHHTRAAFDSPLWSLLEGAAWSPSKREGEIERLLDQLEYFETGPSDRFVLSVLRRPDFRDLRRNRSFYRKVLGQIARKRSLDGILLLCLLYRRYSENGRWGEAGDVRKAVVGAIYRYCDRPGFHRFVYASWLFITRRRVFAGQPSLEHTSRAITEARSSVGAWERPLTPVEERQWSHDQDWLYGCINDNFEETPKLFIIPKDHEVDLFISGREQFLNKEIEVKFRPLRRGRVNV